MKRSAFFSILVSQTQSPLMNVWLNVLLILEGQNRGVQVKVLCYKYIVFGFWHNFWRHEKFNCSRWEQLIQKLAVHMGICPLALRVVAGAWSPGGTWKMERMSGLLKTKRSQPACLLWVSFIWITLWTSSCMDLRYCLFCCFLFRFHSGTLPAALSRVNEGRGCHKIWPLFYFTVKVLCRTIFVELI